MKKLLVIVLIVLTAVLFVVVVELSRVVCHADELHRVLKLMVESHNHHADMLIELREDQSVLSQQQIIHQEVLRILCEESNDKNW